MYRDAMLVPIRTSTNMADGNQQKHVSPSFVACENIRFSSLLALRRWGETSPAAKSEEKRMFSQATSFATKA